VIDKRQQGLSRFAAKSLCAPRSKKDAGEARAFGIQSLVRLSRTRNTAAVKRADSRAHTRYFGEISISFSPGFGEADGIGVFRIAAQWSSPQWVARVASGRRARGRCDK
jgi:hypothetical protein